MTKTSKFAVSAAQRECFFTLRSRAYELADSGRYRQWSQVAYALLAEGFLPSNITRFDKDPLGVMMITRNCKLAIAAIPSPHAPIRKWLGRLLPRLL